MSRITELREQQARIHTNAKAKLDEITDATPEDRAAEINTEFDRMMADYDKIEAQVQRAEQLEKAERALNAPDKRRPNADAEGKGSDDGKPVAYRDAFHAWLRTGGNAEALKQEERAALQAGFSAFEERAQTAGTNTAGGYTVPTELQNMLVRSMLAWGPMYSDDVGTVISTASGNPLPIPTINDTAVATTTTAEGVTLTDDGSADAAFGQKQLDAFSFNTKWLRVSYELANDSIFAMETLLGDLLGERLGRQLNVQLTTGTGSGAPNGVLTASTAGKTAASTTAFTWDELMDLEHSIDPAYRQSPKVRYMFNDTVLLAARKLKDGQGNYLWQSGDVQGGVPASFNGRPYSINQAMPSALTTGQKLVLFGDFSKYFVRKVGGVIIGAMQDKDFWPGFGIAGYVRVDGELVDTAAIKHLKLA